MSWYFLKLPSLNFQDAFLLHSYLLLLAWSVPSLLLSFSSLFCPHTLCSREESSRKGNEHWERAHLQSVPRYLSVHLPLPQKHMGYGDSTEKSAQVWFFPKMCSVKRLFVLPSVQESDSPWISLKHLSEKCDLGIYARIRKNIFLTCVVEAVLILSQDRMTLTAIFLVSGSAKRLCRKLYHSAISAPALSRIVVVVIRCFPKWAHILIVQKFNVLLPFFFSLS